METVTCYRCNNCQELFNTEKECKYHELTCTTVYTYTWYLSDEFKLVKLTKTKAYVRTDSLPNFSESEIHDSFWYLDNVNKMVINGRICSTDANLTKEKVLKLLFSSKEIRRKIISVAKRHIKSAAKLQKSVDMLINSLKEKSK